jgi:hypothetical protein
MTRGGTSPPGSRNARTSRTTSPPAFAPAYLGDAYEAGRYRVAPQARLRRLFHKSGSPGTPIAGRWVALKIVEARPSPARRAPPVRRRVVPACLPWIRGAFGSRVQTAGISARCCRCWGRISLGCLTDCTRGCSRHWPPGFLYRPPALLPISTLTTYATEVCGWASHGKLLGRNGLHS